MRRIVKVSVLVLLYGIVELFNHFFLLLDEIIYPSYKKVTIRTPLFIISMPRTATTWLQNVICKDQEQFTSMKLWEMLLAPSIIQKKALVLFAKADRRVGQPFTRILRNWDKKIFSGYMPAHPSSFFGYEDDDLILINIFSNLFLVFIFPDLKLTDFLTRFDLSKDEKRKQKILSFYRKCIQKHMYVFGKGKTYLSKSASHSPKMRSLLQIFPDARFLYTLRDPAQSIPSTISLVNRFGEFYSSGVDSLVVAERTLRICDRLYAYPLNVFVELPPNQYFIGHYDDLTADISREIKRIYRHFGYLPSTVYLRLLDEERQISGSYKSNHSYRAENWGFTNEQIESRYNWIYRQYCGMITLSDTPVGKPLL